MSYRAGKARRASFRVKRSHGIKLPYDIDFTAAADGSLPGMFTAPTWSVVSGRAVNNPGKTELSGDPTLEGSYSAGLNSVLASTGGTVAQSATAFSGTKSQRHDPTAANQRVYLAGKNSAVGKWYQLDVQVQRVSGTTDKTATSMFNGSQLPENSQSFLITNTGTWQQFKESRLANAVGLIFAGDVSNAASSDPVLMDDLHLYELTFPDLFAWLPPTQSDVVCKIVPETTWVDDTLFGMAVRSDGPAGTNMLYVLCYTYATARSSYVRWAVVKKIGATQALVAGPGIAVINSGAWLEARLSGNALSLYYDGVLLTSYTITDAELLSPYAAWHGLFSSGGQKFRRFFLGPS